MTEAAIAEVSAADPLDGGDTGEERSLTSDAWRAMRRNPMFWVSATMITIFVLMALFPCLFTSTDPTLANLAESRSRPGDGTWFGRDIQGYDIYARCVYGARASILVGLFTTVFTVLLGGFLGVMSGYLGGGWDSLISRVGDVFFAIPLLLGAIIFLVSLPEFFNDNYFLIIMKVVLALSVLGWPALARLMRSQRDPGQAERLRAGGPGPRREPDARRALAHPAQLARPAHRRGHHQPRRLHRRRGNPVLPRDRPAAAGDLLGHRDQQRRSSGLRTTPHMLVFPSVFLSLCVLAFIMLGDVVRDALDPKNR